MKRVLAFMILGAVFCMTAAGCGKTENISGAKTETEAAGTAGAESAGGGTEEVESQAAADSEPLAEFDVSFANEPFEKPDTADFYKENEWGVQTLLFFTNGQDALPLAAAALKEAGVDILMDESGEYPQKGTQNFIQSSSTNAQGELAACSGNRVPV